MTEPAHKVPSAKELLKQAEDLFLAKVRKKQADETPLTMSETALLVEIARDEPAAEELTGRVKYFAALVVVFASAVILGIGLQTAPVTAVLFRVHTDYVRMQVVAGGDPPLVSVAPDVAVASLDVDLAGTMAAMLSDTQGQLKPCDAVPMASTARLLSPSDIDLVLPAGSETSIEVWRRPGAEKPETLRFLGKGAIAVEATIRGTVAGGDCSQFAKPSPWTANGRLTFLADAAIGDNGYLVEVGTPPTINAAQALRGLSLHASDVQFRAPAARNLQWQGTLLRCAITKGAVDFEQTIPFVGISRADRQELNTNDCPIVRSTSPQDWLLDVVGTAEGGLDVYQRSSKAEGVGEIYIEGVGRGTRLGANYLTILTTDPNVLTILSVVGFAFANAFSLIRIARKALKI
jgi:hypothetical protein